MTKLETVDLQKKAKTWEGLAPFAYQFDVVYKLISNK